MLLLFFVAASLLIFALRGGTARGLAGLRLRWAWLILLACAVQIGVMYALPLTQPWVGARGPVLVASYGCLLAALAVNWRTPWIPVLTIGAALNFAAMASNGGQMPVAPDILMQARMARLAPGLGPGTPVAGSKDVVLPREQTPLWFLGDVFIWPPVPRNAVFSIGDVLIAFGAAMLVQSAVAQRRRPAQAPIPIVWRM